MRPVDELNGHLSYLVAIHNMLVASGPYEKAGVERCTGQAGPYHSLVFTVVVGTDISLIANSAASHELVETIMYTDNAWKKFWAGFSNVIC